MTEVSPIDNRYGSEEMRTIWTPQNRLESMVRAEVALMKAQADLNLIHHTIVYPPKPVRREEVEVLEKEYGHEVVALIAWLERETGYCYWHFGATSSDIVDTTNSVIMRQAGDIITQRQTEVLQILQDTARTYFDTPCLGRTHGQAAVPMTFGHKFTVFYSMMERSWNALADALTDACVAKMSGAVGNYAMIGGPEIERLVAAELYLKPAQFSTQIFPRDAMARVVTELGILSSVAEHIANEIRNLSRTEIGEVSEPSTRAGSSTMVQKHNPIKCEKVCGLARVVRGHVLAMLENVVSDHERDLRNSSVERVVLPEIFMLVDEQLGTLINVLKGLEVNTEVMDSNLGLGSDDTIFAEAVLLDEVRKGTMRMVAYKQIQAALDCDGGLWIYPSKRDEYAKKYLDGSMKLVEKMRNLGEVEPEVEEE